MSPIKGRENRTRQKRVGKIHLGVKKKNAAGVEYPAAVNHFVVHADDTTPSESALAFFEQFAGCSRCNDGEDVECNGVRELFPVVFPTDNPQEWSDERYKMYAGSLGLTCAGDGESALAKWDKDQTGKRPEDGPPGTWANGKSKDWQTTKIPCHGPLCPQQEGKKPNCGIVMDLQFMLPTVRGIGVWHISTKSLNSIDNIRDCVQSIKSATGGRIRGLPLTLSMVPKVVTPKGEKKKTVWVMDLSLPNIPLYELLEMARKLPENMLMLPPPTAEDDDSEPEDDEPEEVLAGETYEHGATDVPTQAPTQARQPDAIENAPTTPEPTATAKPPTAKRTKPAYEAIKDNAGPKNVQSVDDLTSYEPANVGELYNQGWTQFRMTRVAIEEIAADDIRAKKFGDAWRKVCAVKNAEAVAEPFA